MGRQCTCGFKMLKENNSVQFKSADRMKYIFKERWNSLSLPKELEQIWVRRKLNPQKRQV